MVSDWRASAACDGMNTELWFPVAEVPKKPEQLREIRIAKETCYGCLVRRECLTFAFETGQRYGIWGGMSERERRTKKGREIGRALVRQALVPA